MSKSICTGAMVGAAGAVARAKAKLEDTINAKGAHHPVGFPGTAYYLPVIYSFTGKKVEILGDLESVLEDCTNLLREPPSEDLWLPYLGNALDAGAATLFAFEAIEACKTVIGPDPTEGLWLGAASDAIMRERGVEFVDGTAPGFAAIIGAAPDPVTAVGVARELQEKNLYVFMAGSVDGETFAEQLLSEGVQLGWETRLVPFGPDVSAAIYALGFANRAALSFGGVAPGDFERNLRYTQNRIFAFVLALGEVDDEKYAAAAGAINYGFPTIADTDIPEILPTGVCTYEHVVSNVAHDRIVERALEVRGCKVKVAKVPIPVAFGPAFEGERIRKVDSHAEFGGNLSSAFEFVQMVDLKDIDDGVIDIIGKDIDEVEEGTALPLAIWVDVAGRKMQADFEPILERQIHHLINSAEGVWHMGQRDIVWTRVSKAAYAKGFRLKHYGEILHAKFLNDYPAIVDKVKVTLITEKDEVERRIEHARKIYIERNHRMASMTDESVDTFYSCLLCQSFAPNHVCIITPERLGLCGAYNWLDGKAAYEIDETGPNQPVERLRCIDPVRGIWEGVNEYVYQNSHKTIESFTAYSLMSNPMTSCGCFEVIVAYVPECNGVMIVNREFMDDTPVGMTFSTLAGMVGGGVQTPGFMGVGKVFLSSKKFISADGGIARVVWMPRELKEMVAEDFKATAEAAGHADLWDKIADETQATAPDAIRAFMEHVEHPALSMTPMDEIWSGIDPTTDTARSSPGGLAEEEPEPNPYKEPPAEPVLIASKPNTAPPTATPSIAETPPNPEPPSPSLSARPDVAGGNGTVGERLAALLQELTAEVVLSQLKKTLTDELMSTLQKSLTDEVRSWLASELKESLSLEIKSAIRAERPQPADGFKREVVREVAMSLLSTFKESGLMDNLPSIPVSSEQPVPAEPPAPSVEQVPEEIPPPSTETPNEPEPATAGTVNVPVVELAQPALESKRSAGDKLSVVTTIAIPREETGHPVEEVTIGATRAEGGTRGSTLVVGGQNCLPFHHFEGHIPHSPAFALEVFDTVNEKMSPVLRDCWGELLERPAEMASKCVDTYGANAISVRLEGTHPEKGGKSPDEALALVREVLAAVDVPIIVTGHSHYDATNEVMKKIAAGCDGERLVLNWVENDNYRTIAGVALAYGHCVVAQSPIDVNLAKQLNILLANMDLPRDRILMDPLTGALGYGIEYTFSVMERIRLTGLGGDKPLAFPMVVSVGQEAWKTKESNASGAAFPSWGEMVKRAVLWEIQTAMPLITAGADLLILNHPESLEVLRRNVAILSAFNDLADKETH